MQIEVRRRMVEGVSPVVLLVVKNQIVASMSDEEATGLKLAIASVVDDGVRKEVVDIAE